MLADKLETPLLRTRMVLIHKEYKSRFDEGAFAKSKAKGAGKGAGKGTGKGAGKPAVEEEDDDDSEDDDEENHFDVPTKGAPTAHSPMTGHTRTVLLFDLPLRSSVG